MKKILAIALLVAFWFPLASLAQGISDFSITMKIDLSQSTMGDMEKAMLEGMTMNYYYDGPKIRLETLNSMSSTTAIVDTESEKGLIMMDMMGMKIAIPIAQEDFDKPEDEGKEVEKVATGRTKMIKGYMCKEFKLDTEDTHSTLWVTDAFQPQSSSKFVQNSDMGAVLESTTESNGMIIFMTAEKIKIGKSDPSLFSLDIPSGFETMSMEDLKNMGQ